MEIGHENVAKRTGYFLILTRTPGEITDGLPEMTLQLLEQQRSLIGHFLKSTD